MKLSWKWAVLFLAAMAIVGYIVTPKEVWQQRAQQREAKQAESAKVNQANFERVAVGMAFKEVEAILGKEYKENSAIGSLQTYSWKGGILKSITIVFDSGRVQSKTSSGLR